MRCHHSSEKSSTVRNDIGTNRGASGLRVESAAVGLPPEDIITSMPALVNDDGDDDMMLIHTKSGSL